VGVLPCRPDLFSNLTTSIPKLPETFRLIPNSYDPPEHRAYSQILMREMFAPRILDALIDQFRALTRSAIDRFADRGSCDFNAEYARPVPVQIFMMMIGIPYSRREEFDQAAEWVFRGTGETVDQGMREMARLLDDWIDEQLQDRHAPREAHMLEAMLNAQIEGRYLTKDELRRTGAMLMLGGIDTVAAATGHVVHFFASHPGHCKQLIDEPGLIPAAVEELRRRFGVGIIGRCARQDFNFHGVDIKEGEMILLSTQIAGLDERRFEDALTVDFHRPGVKGKSLAFGTGIHLCSGHNLARRELRVTIEELLPRLENLRIAPRAVVEYASGGTLSVSSPLPLVWDAVSPSA
jgi:cytochrome P450